jgi:hypothetical protein
MPNWCRCRLSISGPEAKVAELLEACEATAEEMHSYKPYYRIEAELQHMAKHTAGTDLSFNKLVPIPQELLAKTYDEGGHEWELKNWGCKWGASRVEHSVDTPGKIELVFDTPWQPPLLWVDKVSELYPELHFIIGYDEPDMNIHGRAEWNDGSIIEAGWEGHALKCLVESPDEGE